MFNPLILETIVNFITIHYSMFIAEASTGPNADFINIYTKNHFGWIGCISFERVFILNVKSVNVSIDDPNSINKICEFLNDIRDNQTLYR